MSDFVHLHVHSEYSLLDGLPHPKDLAARAAELQQTALALTDHGSMFAAIDFYDACKAKNVKPIIGIEAYLAKRRMKDKDSKEDRSSNHLLLLVENDQGYQNLLKLVSAAELEGFYYYPRVDHELLAKYSDGIIVTTGCPSGEVPRLLHDGRIEEARKAFAWYRDVFKDRFYVELQEHGIAEFLGLDKQLIALGREFNVPLLATNDAHYLRPQDANAQDILLCIQTNTVITDPKRMRMDGSDYYLKSSEEMATVWREVPEALRNTLVVAERCNVDLSFKGYKLPKFPVPDSYSAESYLRHLCEIGFKKYFPNGDVDARQRLDYELGVIHSMGFDTYFLIVWDLIRFAKEQNIWFNVRGSAAGSMAAYCAGITNLDPIKHRLIFERFLNPGRISMPDIDLDFQDNRRAELITYTIQKYGKDNVAQIVTFGTLGAKAAIRDVGRALDYPLSEVDRVAKLVPTGPNVKLADSLENVGELKQIYEENDYLRKLIDNARLLEGVARHASTHAAGVVVTDKPVVEYVPLHRPTKGEDSGGFPITQFEMGVLERVGLLKMDYLGLATLTIMRRACELIEKRHGVSYDLSNIPVEDPKAFELMSRGDVTGIFQIEGCLSGDTHIGHRTIKELYHQFITHQPDQNTPWMHRLKTDSCYLDQGVLTKNEIVKVVYSGVKPVYRLVDEQGRWIKATAEHHLLTQRGWVRLGDLDPSSDCILTKTNASRLGRLCAECGKPLKSASKKARYCKACSARITANPSRPEVRELISRKNKDNVAWNRGLTAETAKDTTWFQHLKIYNDSQRGVSMEERYGAEKAAKVKAILSQRFSGRNNPMFGRPPKFTKTYTRDGVRADLGHSVRSSWEADLARVLRHEKLEYQYEPRTFELVADDGRTLTYTPDFYVPALNQWFEVKGWMDAASAEKIALFRRQYPDCDLVVIDKTRFAEFQLQYADLVEWECPQIPRNASWSAIRSIEFIGEEETFDLQMRPPGNNFVANGFIVHNSGMRKMVMQMKPHKFEHIVAGVSLFRPGPMDYIPNYINRLHGLEKVEYKHPILAQVLDETFGIIVYQEQIIQTAVMLAGYKPGEADEIRKAVGKKIKEKIDAHRSKFVKGAVANGVDKSVAESVYDDIEFFARYGFNKAHGSNYAVLTCQTAFLKAHYPIEYMTALLTTETGNIEKVGLLVNEVRRMGIEVLPPDVNFGDSDFAIAPNGKAIYFALSAIKNVGGGPVQVILNARSKGGAFKSLDDFCRRVDLRQVNRRVLESLIKAGAMDRFGRRSQLLKVLDRMIAASQAAHHASDRGQLSMFGTIAAAPGMLADTFGTLPDETEIPNRDKLADEKELTGAYFSDNPLMRLSRSSHKNVSHFVNQLDESLVKQSITLVGVVTSSRIITTKKGDPMAFVQIEDPTGSAEITVFPKIYARNRELWHIEALLLVKGKVELRDGKIQVLCDSAEEYEIEDVPMGSLPTQGAESPVQIAIPSEDEAAIANVAHVIEELQADYDDLPPLPEEPPDEFSRQLPIVSRQTTMNSQPSIAVSNQSTVFNQPSTVNRQPTSAPAVSGNGITVAAKSNGGNGFAAVYAAAPASSPRFQSPRHLRIFITRTENYEEDVRRMREVILLLSAAEGRDRFSFYVPNPQGMVQLDFPNHSTNYSQVADSLNDLISDWGRVDVQ